MEIHSLGVVLILGLCILIPILLFLNIYFMIKWQHPDDANNWVTCKLVVVTGSTLVQLVVVGLPLDVANNSGAMGCSYDWGVNSMCGGLDMVMYWQVVLLLTMIWFFGLVPLCIFAYEAYDEADRSSARAAWRSAFCWELALLCVVGTVVGCMFALMNEFRLPHAVYEGDVSYAPVRVFNASRGDSVLEAMGALEDAELAAGDSSASESAINMPARFFEYATALTSWIGWFLFSLWGGIGLAALPIDLVLAYVYRPVPMDAREVAEYRLQVQKRVAELLDVGQSLALERAEFGGEKRTWWENKTRNGADQIRLNKFKQMVYITQADIDDLLLCSTRRAEYEPLLYVAKLVAGVVALIHSLLWVVHTIVYLLIDPPASGFLNDYLISFAGWYPLFGAVGFMLFALYMLAATIKGCFKFGTRFFLVSLHPMKYNGTYMNSFLFNVSLFLLCSFPTAQFCAGAFAGYAQYSDAATIFAVVKHLTFFRSFYETHCFEYLLIIFFAISSVYLLLSPRDVPASSAKLKASLTRPVFSASSTPPPRDRGALRHNPYNAL